ncbi:ABC transporter, ATP-binding protein, partial [Corynebacterium accolens ATCC 49726]
ERIGLVGVNGSGKTTLLRTLAGEYELAAGKRIEGQTVRLGWLRQELDDLDPQRRLLDAVEDVATYVQLGKKELSASQLAERLGFSAKRQRTPVGDLSGGERRRLQLTRVLMAEPNVLLLDEPTNDLDIDTLQELESLLDSWPGTLVVISHDRYLIERIADNTYALFGDGKLTNLPGGIDEYLRKREEIEAGKNTGVINLGEKKTGAPAPKPEKKLSSQQEREITKKMNALERKMQKLEKSAAQINEKLAAAAEEVDTEAMTRLDTELKDNRSAYEDLEMEWLELGEKLEQ